MKRRFLLALVALAAASLALGGAQATSGSTPKLDPVAFGQTLFAAIPPPIADPTDPPGFFQVKATEFDPAHTNLVQGGWLNAIGCPTDAFIAVPNTDFTGVAGTDPYTDLACPTGDSNDQRNMGLLLVKTGPTSNFASAGAELHNVKGITLTELGWDIRKGGGSSASPLGSHCGAGAPRWNILTTTNFHFLGCNSPPATTQVGSTGWIRMRWNAAGLLAAFPPILPTEVVTRIQIVFDEGQDTGPDFFGAAILDNIDVNGALVGHGSVDAD